jgi:hypothetical protein
MAKIKIKFPHDDLCRRAATVLGIHPLDVIEKLPLTKSAGIPAF